MAFTTGLTCCTRSSTPIITSRQDNCRVLISKAISPAVRRQTCSANNTSKHDVQIPPNTA